jgi:hypothetical protein
VNPVLLVSTVASVALVAATVSVGPLRSVLGTTSLTLPQQLVVVALALVPFVATEASKVWARRA